MSDLNVDDFYKDVAIILDLAYRQFPKKISLYVEDISGPDTQDEFGLQSPRHTAAYSAVLWLADEGYIRYSDAVRQESFEEVTLTQQAFMRLSSARIDELDINVSMAIQLDQHAYINLIRNAIAHRSSTELALIVRELLLTTTPKN
jgi:hypothetical protein